MNKEAMNYLSFCIHELSYPGLLRFKIALFKLGFAAILKPRLLLGPEPDTEFTHGECMLPWLLAPSQWCTLLSMKQGGVSMKAVSCLLFVCWLHLWCTRT